MEYKEVREKALEIIKEVRDDIFKYNLHNYETEREIYPTVPFSEVLSIFSNYLGDEKTFSKDIVKKTITTKQQYIDKKRIIAEKLSNLYIYLSNEGEDEDDPKDFPSYWVEFDYNDNSIQHKLNDIYNAVYNITDYLSENEITD